MDEYPASPQFERTGNHLWPGCPLGRHNLLAFALDALAMGAFVAGWYLLVAPPLVVMIVVTTRDPAQCTCARRQRGLDAEHALSLE